MDAVSMFGSMGDFSDANLLIMALPAETPGPIQLAALYTQPVPTRGFPIRIFDFLAAKVVISDNLMTEFGGYFAINDYSFNYPEIVFEHWDINKYSLRITLAVGGPHRMAECYTPTYICDDSAERCAANVRNIARALTTRWTELTA